jgi:hypothetical protein
LISTSKSFYAASKYGTKDEALKSIRARATEMNITDEDIEAEIRAVRAGK